MLLNANPCESIFKEALQALTSDILAELGSDLGQPVVSRLKVVRELQGQVREKRLQEQGVLLLWVKLEDLLRPDLVRLIMSTEMTE